MARLRSEDLDDSVPELVYQCISVIDADSCKKDEVYVKCPLCKQFGKNFYCSECVKNGNFLHSKKKCYERFADKKVSKYKLDAEKAIILQRFEDFFAPKKQVENLRLEIYKSKEKIQLLKASIRSFQGTIQNDEKIIGELERKNSKRKLEQSILQDKLFARRRIERKKSFDLISENRKLDVSRSALQTIIQHRIQELINYIFPIAKATLHRKNTSSSEEGQFAELEEAQKTTYVQGQWVIAGSAMDDVQYSVIEPCIPSNGDYSAYTTWCTDPFHSQGVSRDSLSIANKCQFDKAYGISAALAYTAQLVGILAFYMDAYVPKKSSFSDFCRRESSRTKFLHKVAKLNANIISLCLSRGVDVTKINAHRTIENLLLLIRTESGEPSSITSEEETQELMESLEDSLSKDLLAIDESDSDEMESEYVHVSEEEFLPGPDQSEAEPIPQPSLVSSVYSFLKVFQR